MGYCPEKVGAQFFPFRLCQCFFPVGHRLALFLERARRRAGKQRDGEHSDKCDRIAGKRKIKMKIRVGKKVVHSSHAVKRCRDPIPISSGTQRGQYESEG